MAFCAARGVKRSTSSLALSRAALSRASAARAWSDAALKALGSISKSVWPRCTAEPS